MNALRARRFRIQTPSVESGDRRGAPSLEAAKRKLAAALNVPLWTLR